MIQARSATAVVLKPSPRHRKLEDKVSPILGLEEAVKTLDLVDLCCLPAVKM